jgi:phosphoribosylformylglycinamidine synthase
LTNLVWARVSALEDVKCSGNWMWAAKLPGEGAALYDAAVALHDILLELGIAIDGGKDSLSMAAHATDESGRDEAVKAPGSLVISAYVTCPDVGQVVTPDLKLPGTGRLLYIDLGRGKHRLGGSALAQVYQQVGDDSPDVEDVALLKWTFRAVQQLISEGLVAAGHDRSDGGLITTLLEMAFAGNCGIDVELDGSATATIPLLFSEELGLVLEVDAENEARVVEILNGAKVPCTRIGRTTSDESVRVSIAERKILDEDMRALRNIWEETSFEIDRLQANPECVAQERKGLSERKGPSYSCRRSSPPALSRGTWSCPTC